MCYFVFSCVLYCIVVPLPPVTYPLAVNNNNSKNSNNHETKESTKTSWVWKIFATDIKMKFNWQLPAIPWGVYLSLINSAVNQSIFLRLLCYKTSSSVGDFKYDCWMWNRVTGPGITLHALCNMLIFSINYLCHTFRVLPLTMRVQATLCDTCYGPAHAWTHRVWRRPFRNFFFFSTSVRHPVSSFPHLYC